MALGDIILGDGVFSFVANASTVSIDFGLTRGGGQFVVEREFRDIEADGDYGPVQNRVRQVRQVPKLTLRGLELVSTDFGSFYAGTAATSSTWSGTLTTPTTSEFLASVSFTGETLGGKDVVITLTNAINRENIDWNMVDKEEVLPEVTFTGHYDNAARTTPPWTVTWSTA